MVITVIMVIAGILYLDGLTASVLVKRLFFPLCRMMLFILMGLVVGEVIEATGWTRHMAKLAGPLFRYGRLGEKASAAFTTAFVSGVSSNAMLYGFYQDGSLNKKQLFLANYINQFPAFFLHLPTTFFIVVPLTGRAGLLYFLLTFLALLLRTGLLFVYGHMSTIETVSVNQADIQDIREPESKQWKDIIKGIRRKLPARITTIAMYVIPIYVLVFLLNKMGGFDAVDRFLSRFIVDSFMPVDSLSVIVLGFTAEFTTGFATAGALMSHGVLTVKQTTLALLIGNVVAFPIRALRHQLPRYVGIFSPKMGTQILIGGQVLRVVSLIVVGVLYYYLTP